MSAPASILEESAPNDARSRALPKPCWAMLGLAAVATASAWIFLESADGLNARTPNLEIPFFASVAAALLAATAIPIELVRSARRAREERAPSRKRWTFHALAVLTVLAAAGSGAITFLAAIFPTC